MPKTHPHNPHPPLRQHLPHKLHQTHNPRIIIKRVVLGPRDEDGVDAGQGGVGCRGGIGDDVVGGEVEDGGERGGGDGAGEEVREDAEVAFVVGVG